MGHSWCFRPVFAAANSNLQHHKIFNGYCGYGDSLSKKCCCFHLQLQYKTALLLNTSIPSPSHWTLTFLGHCLALLVICWLCSVEQKDAFAFWLFGNYEFWNHIKTYEKSELHQKIALLPLLHLNPIDSKFFFIQTSRTKTRMGIKIQTLLNRGSLTNKIERQNKKKVNRGSFSKINCYFKFTGF